MKAPVTLKQLAQNLQLSIATVSRALKDHPDISPETKRKVQELANVLEYEPNAHAISLKTNTSKEFAIIVPEIAGYFYNYFIAAIEEEARRIGYSVVILQSGHDPQLEIENVRRCRKSRVAGMFISTVSGGIDLSECRKAEDNGIPVIFFDKVPVSSAFNKVCVADEEAAELAAQALIRVNKKNILALFGDAAMSITATRQQAFCNAIQRDAPHCKLHIVEATNSENAFRLSSTQIKTKKPDALFCMSDEILAGALKAIQKIGLHMPYDIGVIAISNGFIPQLYYPEITYVETSGFKLGKLAFARMMACLAGSTFMQTIRSESILVKGGSL